MRTADYACSLLPGATKGNTLQAARVKLRGGVSKTTVEACDLERSQAKTIRFGPRHHILRETLRAIFSHGDAAPAAG